MQKTAFYNVKGILSQRKRYRFAIQNKAFVRSQPIFRKGQSNIKTKNNFLKNSSLVTIAGKYLTVSALQCNELNCELITPALPYPAFML